MSFKKLISALLIGASVVSLAGCGSQAKSASSAKSSAGSQTASSSAAVKSDVLKEVVEKTAAEKNYTAKMNVDFTFEDSGKTDEATVDTAITSVENPLSRHITIDTKENGNQLNSSEFYVDTDSSKKKLYLSYQNEWYKMDVDDNTLYAMLGQYDIKSVLNVLLSNASDAKKGGKETVNGTECVKIDAVIKSDAVPQTILKTGVFVVTGLVNLSAEHMSGVGDMPVTFWVNAKTNEVVKFTFDAGKAYQQIADNAYESMKASSAYSSSAQKLSVGKFAVTTDITNIGSTNKTAVPDDIIKNAKDVPTSGNGASSAAGSSAAASSAASSKK